MHSGRVPHISICYIVLRNLPMKKVGPGRPDPSQLASPATGDPMPLSFRRLEERPAATGNAIAQIRDDEMEGGNDN